MFPKLSKKGFEVQLLHHAEAILTHDMTSVEADIESVLDGIEIPLLELVKSGGGEAKVTQRIRRGLAELGWLVHVFEIKKTVDGFETECKTHKIDHVKKFDAGVCAIEIEWNNKDPFFDRDLENFKRLHADGAISIGVIITRGSSLQSILESEIEGFARREGLRDLTSLNSFYEPTTKQKKKINKSVERFANFEKGWAHEFVSDKFGSASTHWEKLQIRVARGVGNPCPLLLIGIPSNVLTR